MTPCSCRGLLTKTTTLGLTTACTERCKEKYIKTHEIMNIEEIKKMLKVHHDGCIGQAAFYHGESVGRFPAENGFETDDIEFAEGIYGNWERDWADKPIEEMLELLRIYDSRIDWDYTNEDVRMSKEEHDKWVENEINEILNSLTEY